MTIDLMIVDPVLMYINFLPCSPGFRTAERELPFPYFLYVHGGRGRFIIDGVPYEALEGDLFFCAQGLKNQIIADDAAPFTLTGIDFHFDRSKQAAPGNLADRYDSCIKTEGRVRWLILELLEQYTRSKGDTPYARSLLKCFLCLAAELSDPMTVTGIARSAQHYLLSHAGESLTVSQVAAELGYHPQYLNRVFKESMGTTIRQFHLDMRIRKAMEFLESTSLNIQTVAAACGFDDQNYFSRLFKRRTGMSPTDYRKLHTTNE